ncbi:hypothetical protein AAY473_021369 [Plecturocebus cupreus]
MPVIPALGEAKLLEKQRQETHLNPRSCNCTPALVTEQDCLKKEKKTIFKFSYNFSEICLSHITGKYLQKAGLGLLERQLGGVVASEWRMRELRGPELSGHSLTSAGFSRLRKSQSQFRLEGKES